MAQMLPIIDYEELSVETSVANSRSWASGPRTQIIAAAVSRDCRTKFGFVYETEANRMVARKWMYDLIIASPDMRKVDASRILNLALILVFIPDAVEVECQQMKVAAAKIQRQREYATKWWDWGSSSPSRAASG